MVFLGVVRAAEVKGEEVKGTVVAVVRVQEEAVMVRGEMVAGVVCGGTCSPTRHRLKETAERTRARNGLPAKTPRMPRTTERPHRPPHILQDIRRPIQYSRCSRRTCP